MFLNTLRTKEKIYNLVDKTANFKDKIKILPVDFQKPWWTIILGQKKTLFLIISIQITWSIFNSVFPIILGYAVLKLDANLFLEFMGLRFVIIWLYNYVYIHDTVLQIQTSGSVEYQANQYFLTVDPICHTTKSSGQITSKISRGSLAFEAVLSVVFDILGIFTSLTTIAITMLSFDLRLGLIATFFLILITTFNITAQAYRMTIFQPKRIKAEDTFKAISLETLLQVPFIRATFASNEQSQKLQKTLHNSMVKTGNSWQGGTYVGFITRFLHILSIFCIGTLVLTQAKAGIFEPIFALSIILAYLNSTQQILTTGNRVKRLTDALTNINDLFDFIRCFGTQTFPVLESENLKLELKN